MQCKRAHDHYYTVVYEGIGCQEVVDSRTLMVSVFRCSKIVESDILHDPTQIIIHPGSPIKNGHGPNTAN